MIPNNKKVIYVWHWWKALHALVFELSDIFNRNFILKMTHMHTQSKHRRLKDVASREAWGNHWTLWPWHPFINLSLSLFPVCFFRLRRSERDGLLISPSTWITPAAQSSQTVYKVSPVPNCWQHNIKHYSFQLSLDSNKMTVFVTFSTTLIRSTPLIITTT